MSWLNKICILLGLILFLPFLTAELVLALDTSCRGGAGATLSAGVNAGAYPEYYGIGSYANSVTCGPSSTYTCPSNNTTKIYIWYDTESGYDKVKIYNGAGTLLADISGSSGGGYIWTGPYSSNTLKFGFTSDGSVTKTGFDIYKIECIAAAVSCTSNPAGCDSVLNCADGTACDCYEECSGSWCWGSSAGSYTCHTNLCAADGKYAPVAGECCNSWNSSTKQCYTACKSNGTTCSAGTECCSGNCVDGYCCNSACGGTCQTCAATAGTCTTRGADNNTECTACHRCDGTNTSCQNQTSVATGYACDNTCTWCNASASCTTRSADDNTECTACHRCDGTNTSCQNQTSVNTGYSCNDDCTWCDTSANCANRSAGATNECPAGQGCNTAGGDCAAENCCNTTDDDGDGLENGYDTGGCGGDVTLVAGSNTTCWWTEWDDYGNSKDYYSGWYTCPTGYIVSSVNISQYTEAGYDYFYIYDSGSVEKYKDSGEDGVFTIDSTSYNTQKVKFRFTSDSSAVRDGVKVNTITCSLPTRTLTVAKAGTGSGTVTSSPAGISCGTDCTENYSSGTSVTLTAAAACGSAFAGWSGDCSGTGTCTLTMSAAKNVTATFSAVAESCCNTVDDDCDGYENGYDTGNCGGDVTLVAGSNTTCWWTEWDDYGNSKDYYSGWYTCPTGQIVSSVNITQYTEATWDFFYMYDANSTERYKGSGLDGNKTVDLSSYNTQKVKFRFTSDGSTVYDGVKVNTITCAAVDYRPSVSLFYATPSDTVNKGGSVSLYSKGTDDKGMKKIQVWYLDSWHTCYCDGSNSPACSVANTYSSTYGYYYCSNSWDFTETTTLSSQTKYYYTDVFDSASQEADPANPDGSDYIDVINGCANWTDCASLSISDSQYVNNMNCSITCGCPAGYNIKITSSGDTESPTTAYDKLNICGTNYSGEWTSQVKDCGTQSATLSFTSDSSGCGNSSCSLGAGSYGYVTINSMQCISVNCVAPGNFRSTTITERSIKVVWDAVTGASLYKAEWCEDGKTWGNADCCPDGTCNITTSDTQTTAPNLMYNTKYNFRVRVNTATGCITPGNWAEISATTAWPECGAGCSTKSSGTDCGYSYGAIGASCIVGGLDNHGLWFDVGVSECYDSALVCRRDMCPAPSNISTPETLLKLASFNDGAICNVTTYWKGLLTCSTLAHAGNWDKSEYKCVRCSVRKENIICGDPSGVYANADTDPCTKTGDNECEAGCTASAFCDEKINSHYYKTSETRLDWCSDCLADYTLCDTYTECDASDPENFGEDFRCYYSGGGYHWGSSASVPTTETECSDGHDNDCDGYTDCDPTWPDSDCTCDSTPPTTSISIKRKSTGLPPTESYLRPDTYTIQFTDNDNVGGSGLKSCGYYINSCNADGTNCTTTVDPNQTRTCNVPKEINLCTSPYTLEGKRYFIYSYATDNVDLSGNASVILLIDCTPPSTNIR